MSLEEDAIPVSLLKKIKPADNGRLEVRWRIYNALCDIPCGDLTHEQREFLNQTRKNAYECYRIEGDLAEKDGLQGPRGFVAIKKEHLKNLLDPYIDED